MNHPMREPAAIACFLLGLVAFGMAASAPNFFLLLAACGTGLFGWYGAWWVWTFDPSKRRRPQMRSAAPQKQSE